MIGAQPKIGSIKEWLSGHYFKLRAVSSKDEEKIGVGSEDSTNVTLGIELRALSTGQTFLSAVWGRAGARPRGRPAERGFVESANPPWGLIPRLPRSGSGSGRPDRRLISCNSISSPPSSSCRGRRGSRTHTRNRSLRWGQIWTWDLDLIEFSEMACRGTFFSFFLVVTARAFCACTGWNNKRDRNVLYSTLT